MARPRGAGQLFVRGDVNGFWALFADNLANMIIVSGVCTFVLKIPGEVVFGRILPALGVSLVLGLGFYAWLARRVGAVEGRDDVTALPYGISTPILFVYLFLIMKPIAEQGLRSGLTEAEAGLLAWRVGMAAAFLGGLIEAGGAFIGPWLKRHLPRAGMLGTLAGIALVWIATVPLAEIFEDPLVGFASMAIILAGLVALYRLPFGIPAGLAAIAVGTLVGFATGHSSFTVEGVGIYVPLPVLGDLWLGLEALFSNPWILAIVLPAEVYNFIETMNNVESAEAAGDRFPVGVCQVADGAGTVIGALFGSAFPTTVYIGHPGYKRLGSRAGYGLAVGLVFFVGAFFGLMAFLHHLVPMAAVAPMLVFIGIVITGQAFTASPPAHALAVAMAMLPHVSNLLMAKWMSLGNVLAGNGGILFDPSVISAMAMEGAHVVGHAALSSGAIIIGLLWGSITAFLLDHKPSHAAWTAGTAAILTAVGVIHASTLGFSITPIAWGYVIVAGVCAALRWSSVPADPGPQHHQ
ncbi:MAG: xanthine/uracil/vitamin C permease [Pseudomonadota bacterium]